MYYEHFGLNYPPFKITPDTQLFYSGGNRGLVLEALIYAINNGEGIIKVVGEVGSGKTMLCRMLEERLPKRIEVVYLANPRLPPEMILHAIAHEMRLPLALQTDRLQAMHALHTRLLEKYANNQQVVVFIEEAQGMPLETLEEIRLLSNLETTRNKLLQIVLFGQPELDTNLSATHIRQLKERITHSFYLKALTRENIREYVHFRMHTVGYRGPPVFSPAAIRLLTKVSKGLMRRVNILADKALLAAFADNVHWVRPRHIRLAARDSGFVCPAIPIRVWVGLLILVVLILGWWFSPYKTFWLELTNDSKAAFPTVPEPNLPVQSESTVANDSLLQQRMQATQQWLTKDNEQYYTLQVLQTKEDNTQDLQNFLRQPEIQPLLEDLYIYRVNRNGQIFWEMLYAEFINADNAITAIATLPKVLQNNKPFLRRIKNLKLNSSE